MHKHSKSDFTDIFPFLDRLILYNRLSWSIRLRWVAVTGFFFATLLAWQTLPLRLPFSEIWFILLVLAFINLLYYTVVKVYKDFSFNQELFFLYFHIILDLVFLTFLIHYSGGIENPIFLFYIFHVVLSSVVFRKRSPFAIATIALLLFAGMLIAEYSGMIAHYSLYHLDLHLNETAILLCLIVFAITVYFTAYIGTTFMTIYRNSKRIIDAKNRQLIEADKQKTRFFRYASHELKSPVIAIKSTIDGVVQSSKSCDDKRVLRLLKRASWRAGQMLEIINELMQLSQSRTRLLEDNRKKFNVIPVIRQIVDHESDAAEQKNVSIQLEISHEPVTLFGNVEDIRKIFVNLINNAVRYTPREGQVSIKVNVDIQQKNFIFVVRDTGIGIANDDLDHIFEEFYRSENAKKFVSFGTGLGLSLVKQIVQNNGGEITVDSRLGEGATFRVSLPIHAEHEHKEQSKDV